MVARCFAICAGAYMWVFRGWQRRWTITCDAPLLQGIWPGDRQDRWYTAMYKPYHLIGLGSASTWPAWPAASPPARATAGGVVQHDGDLRWRADGGHRQARSEARRRRLMAGAASRVYGEIPPARESVDTGVRRRWASRMAASSSATRSAPSKRVRWDDIDSTAPHGAAAARIECPPQGGIHLATIPSPLCDRQGLLIHLL